MAKINLSPDNITNGYIKDPCLVNYPPLYKFAGVTVIYSDGGCSVQNKHNGSNGGVYDMHSSISGRIDGFKGLFAKLTSMCIDLNIVNNRIFIAEI